jgi:hypothetical protein
LARAVQKEPSVYRSIILSALVLATGVAPLRAAEPTFADLVTPETVTTPQVDPDTGEFVRSTILDSDYWIVRELDWENGLYGRMVRDFPEDPTAIDAELPEDRDIQAWPVMASFAPRQLLTAVRGNRGVMIREDSRGKAWLLVKVYKMTYVYVRCHPNYVLPVRVQGASAAS